MRFLSFRIDGEHKYGAVIENRVVELSSRMSNHATLLDVMADGALVRAKDIAAESSADYELKEIEFLPPIVNPGKIVCVSESYAEASESPEVSFPPPDSFVGHGESLRLPPEGSQLDYEAEFALIVSGGGRRIPEKAARSAIAGVTLACVGAVKEESDDPLDNPSQGKHLASSCAIGPWLVTVDDIPDLDNITVSAHINEELQGHYSSSDLQLSFAPLISYLSTFMPLNPGDVILTRAPGSAAAEKPSTLRLKSGDRLIVHSDDIGTLENPVMEDGGEPQ